MSGPPPWTTSGLSPTYLSSTTSRANSSRRAGSSMAAPPYLMTTVRPWNSRMYGSASSRVATSRAGAMAAHSCRRLGVAALRPLVSRRAAAAQRALARLAVLALRLRRAAGLLMRLGLRLRLHRRAAGPVDHGRRRRRARVDAQCLTARDEHLRAANNLAADLAVHRVRLRRAGRHRRRGLV